MRLTNYQLIIGCILLFLIFPSNSFYIRTLSYNTTLDNGQQLSIFYQPIYYCKQVNETCEANQTFNIQIQALHECLPSQILTFDLICPKTCVLSTLYLNCANTFTGQNETAQFTAIIAMNSTTNSSHNAAANFTINATWIAPYPKPDNGSSNWPIYVAVVAGAVLLMAIGICIVLTIRKKRRDNYVRM